MLRTSVIASCLAFAGAVASVTYTQNAHAAWWVREKGPILLQIQGQPPIYSEVDVTSTSSMPTFAADGINVELWHYAGNADSYTRLCSVGWSDHVFSCSGYIDNYGYGHHQITFRSSLSAWSDGADFAYIEAYAMAPTGTYGTLAEILGYYLFAN